jgi:nanoRNase/pAp phosphatase (c-di-AMP/oligoRNAs hydrolase)
MKATVIFQSADEAGIFFREFAGKLNRDAEFIGWNFGDPPLKFPQIGCVYVLDLPPEDPFGRELEEDETERLICIDHPMNTKYQFNGHRTDGVSACRLAWQWFQQIKIATKYGGGGHKGACGFTCASIPPFLPNL